MSDNETKDRDAASDAAVESGELEQLRRERDEHLAAWQRAQADYQNLRRRMGTDIDSAVARAKQSLLQELLLVLDYLDMALASPANSEETRNLRAGVELTRAQLWRVLEAQGLRLVAESGKFDAGMHQAVETVPTAEHAPGMVIQTLRRGYWSGTQILRPAQVRVSGPIEQA
jgi:molecular chaperone GrpE